MAPSCKFKSPVWEHFDFLVAILLLFYVCRWKNIHIYIMSTSFGCKMLEPNRNNRKPTSTIKTEPKKIWTVAALKAAAQWELMEN